ncbi:MAG: membrane protein insertase YidC [Candidatus Omnitrophota bacterium]
MEKRLGITIALSLLVLVVWSVLTQKMQPIDNKAVTQQNNIVINAQEPQLSIPGPSVVSEEQVKVKLTNYSQENFDIVFNESQGSIQEIIFKGYQNHKFALKEGLLLDDKKLQFKRVAANDNTVIFVAEDAVKRVTKKFIFSKSNYGLYLELKIQNLTNGEIKIDYPVVLGVLDFAGDQNTARFQDIAIVTDEKTVRPNVHKDTLIDNIKFATLRDQYFCAIIQPEAGVDKYSASVKKLGSNLTEVALMSNLKTLSPNKAINVQYHIYLGPQHLKTINAIKPDWTIVINFGMFDIISQILLQTLEFIHNIVGNWGWAIIILSLLVYLIFYPLTLKQMRSMKEMQAIQPKVEELRKAYKDNPQRLNKEIMELYKEHKVNPFGGCLPMLLQMPIFFALYQALMRSVVLKGAKFLWISDLSAPDRFFKLPVSIPMLGEYINILPIIMAVGMFIQQKLSMANMTGSSAEQQKMMLIIMPVMFGIIFYNMPSGLVLYWFINSMLMLAYQIRVSRVTK